MKTFYFTYGSNHRDERGESLGDCYTPVHVSDSEIAEAESAEDAARKKMFQARGSAWSMVYESEEDAGVEGFNLQCRPLETVAFDKQRIRRELIARRLSHERSICEDALEKLSTAARIMERLSEEQIEQCSYIANLTPPHLMIYHCDRERALAAMSALNAGRWEKRVNGSNATRIDYFTEIDGLRVELFSVPPPESCRIVEETEEVPAHTVVKRRLVCA